jgi:hypothetical protein
MSMVSGRTEGLKCCAQSSYPLHFNSFLTFFYPFGDLSFASAVVVIHLAVGLPCFFLSDLCSFTYSISDDQRAATDPIDFIITQFGSCVDLATMPLLPYIQNQIHEITRGNRKDFSVVQFFSYKRASQFVSKRDFHYS